MLRHIILLRWSPDTTPDQKKAAEAGFHALPAAITEIRALTCGADLGLGGTYDYAAALDFDDVAGWRAYQAHPAHRAFVDGVLKPVLAERAAVQIDV
ncbi:Dabb family protein [Actinomadura sp. 9N407]|uniref:Dabb family protein n=1 Tax=Actinomadura sp. 9N407 TaxID=3375154 RepID=UPI0037918020